MVFADFIKKLSVFGVLYGPKAKKLTGISDSANVFTGNLAFVAPGTITLPTAAPEFLTPGTQFRIKTGGGPNQDLLFKVASVLGNVVTVDPAQPVFNHNGTATVDARMATVISNPGIARLNAQGATIFNSNYQGPAPALEGCSPSLIMAEHYHDDPGTISGDNYSFEFTLTDWFSTDGGDAYSIDVSHGLATLYPRVTVFEDPGEEVWLHQIRVIDGNTVRIKVSQRGADGRFVGRGIVGPKP